jgi:hypothetical protein
MHTAGGGPTVINVEVLVTSPQQAPVDLPPRSQVFCMILKRVWVTESETVSLDVTMASATRMIACADNPLQFK